MGVHIAGESNNVAVLFCSTSDVAFGPVFYPDDDHSAEERAEAFCRWLKTDARTFTDQELSRKYSEWLSQEAKQYKAEEEAEAARWADD